MQKTKILNLTGYRVLPICINEQNFEGFDQFLYLDNVFFADASIQPHTT